LPEPDPTPLSLGGTSAPQERGPSPFFKIAAVSAVILAALVAALVIVLESRARRVVTATPPAAEERAYFQQIEFTGAKMSAAENLLGHTVVYLDAHVTNKGQKSITRLETQLEFVDVFNQVVLRETATPVTDQSKPLGPGETRVFRVTFDHMPADWNQGPPRITPTQVKF